MNLYTHCFCSLTGGSLKTYTFRGEAKALAYCDNIKPYVTKKSESFLIEKQLPLLSKLVGVNFLEILVLTNSRYNTNERYTSIF